MKPTAFLRSLLATTGSALLSMAYASAATFYYDGGGTTTTGNGWGTANNWSTDLAGTTNPLSAPTSADDVIFSITSAAAGVVGMNADRAVNSLTFSSTVANTLMAHTTTTTANSLTIGAGGVTINSGAGAVTFGVSTRGILTTILGASQSWTHNGANTFSVIQPVNLGANTLTLAGSGAGTVSISGKISGTGGIIMNKTGGAVTLSGANDYSGGFTLSNGRVEGITGAYVGFGTGTLTLNGGNMHFSGSSTIANNMVWNGSLEFSRPGTGTPIATFNGNVDMTGNFTTTVNAVQPVSGVVFNGNINNAGVNRTLTLGGNTAYTVNGAMSGAIALTKSGTGTIRLTGSNNISGMVTVSDGTMAMTSPSVIGGLNVASGKTFVYAPVTAGALNLGSGTLTLASAVAANTALGGTVSQSAITTTGAATMSGTGVVNIRAVDGVAPAAGTHNLITAASGLTGGTYTLNRVYNNTNFTLSNFTRTATAISVDVASASAISGTVYWKGGLTGTTGVWSATNGSTQSNWQVTDGVNQGLAPGATADLVFSTATSPGTMAGMTLGANMTVRTLTINNTATAFSLNADGFGTNNILTITPSSSSTGITIGSGVQALSIAAPMILGADQKWTNNSSNLFTVSGTINTNGNDLEIAGRTTISGAISGNGGITKSGSGTFILDNTSNSYTGPTRVLGGVLQIGGTWQNNASIPGGIQGNPTSGSNLEINGGVVALHWDMARLLGSGAGAVQITGGRSGFAMLTDPRNTVTLGGSTGYELVWGTSFFNPSIFVMNDSAAGGTEHLILKNKIDLNGADRTIETANSNAASYGEIDQIIRNTSGTPAGLIKIGAGELRLSAANTYNGGTTVDVGTLRMGNASALGSTTAPLTVNSGGTLNLNNFDLTIGNLTGTGGTIRNDVAGTKTLTIGNGNNGGGNFQGAIINGTGNIAVTKTGTGTITLSGANTYTGATTVNGGTLEIATGGNTASASTVTVNNSGSALIVNGTVNGALVANTSTTISGSGTVGGATTISGTHNPGNSPGIQTFGSNLTYSGGSSVVNWELSDNTVSNLPNPNAIFDQIIVGGNLDFTNLTTLNLSFTTAGSSVLWSNSFWDTAQIWVLYDVTGTTSNFANLTLTTINWLDSGSNAFNSIRNGNSFSLSQVGNDVVLNYNVVPEPRAALLGGLGMLLLLRRRRS